MSNIFSEVKDTLVSFGSFLLHPNDRKDPVKKSVFAYVIAFICIYGLAFLIKIILLLVLTQLGVQTVPSDKSWPDLLLWQIIVFGWLLAPVLEEFVFRYPLKYTRNSLAIGLAAFGIMFCMTRGAMDGISFERLQKALILCAAAAMFFIITRNNRANDFLQKIWQRSLPVLVYLLAGYFAILHFGLPMEGANWAYLPLVVFPSFIFALYLSYLRLKVNFAFCICFHIGHNLILGLPILFM